MNLIYFVFVQGQIVQWINSSSFVIDTDLRNWTSPRLGYGNYIKFVSYFFLCTNISFICMRFNDMLQGYGSRAWVQGHANACFSEI